MTALELAVRVVLGLDGGVWINPHGPVVSFDHQRDLCLSFFAEFWNSGKLSLPEGARVLELGCAEADWLKSMREARPDLYLVGIDQRKIDREFADEVIKADILTYAFPLRHFDAVVACSVVHWCGLGHYGDPVDSDGDTKLMQSAHLWLKPSGWMYFDVCSGASRPIGSGPRRYELHDINERLLKPKDINGCLLPGQWRIVHRQEFEGRLPDEDRVHPDGPYMAHVVVPV